MLGESVWSASTNEKNGEDKKPTNSGKTSDTIKENMCKIMCWKNCCSQWRVWFRPIVITVYILFVIIIVPTLIVNSGNCTLNHGHKMGKTAGCIFPLDAVVEIAWKKYQTSTDCDTRIHSNRNFSARWIHTQRSVDLNWWLICADRNTNVGVAHQSTHHPFYETRSAETNYTRPMDGSHLCQQCGM